MPMQLKDGRRPEQTPMIWARPARGHGSPSQVKQSNKAAVVTSGVKVARARIDTSGMRTGETPHARYSHLNIHNGTINVQTNVRVCSIKKV